jgi:hypothetical protein
LYDHAYFRALEARTGGERGDREGGEAHVNVKVFEEFNAMKKLLSNSECHEAVNTKKAIVNHLKVPMIQGLLRVAFQREHWAPDANKKAEVDMLTVWGATYAAAVLPWIHNCSVDAAKEVFEMMRVESHNKDVDFSRMQNIIEPLYKCLETTCEEVGGIWNNETGTWYPGGEPCGMVRTDDKLNYKLRYPDKSKPMGTMIGAAAGIAVALLVACLCYRRRRNRKNTTPGSPVKSSRSTTSTYSDSNIAAVAEIS